MGLIREPLDVDFYVVNRPLTAKERQSLSKFIRKRKKENRRNGVYEETMKEVKAMGIAVRESPEPYGSKTAQAKTTKRTLSTSLHRPRKKVIYKKIKKRNI
jgi:hypothetical protein